MVGVTCGKQDGSRTTRGGPLVKHVVLGGDGFLGRHLADALADRGETVIVGDIEKNATGIYDRVEHRHVDISDPGSLRRVAIGPGDVVHHLASRQYKRDVPRRARAGYFESVNITGTANILRWMAEGGADRLILFSTDMVYGVPLGVPVGVDHPQRPLGPYGDSKRRSEELCLAARAAGLRVTILRPRLIIGPGAHGALDQLFRLVRHHLPVPMIGSGRNRYQMVSVFDCVGAALCALAARVPDAEYNLGSRNPPPVRELLGQLIARAGSHSPLIPLPSRPIKWVLGALDGLGLPLLYREQYGIADVDYVVETARTERELGWSPRDADVDMLCAAYEDYRRRRA